MFRFKIRKIRYEVIILLLVSGITYLPIMHSYFQQDEWTGFAIYFSKYGDTLKSLLFFFKPNVDHYVPLSDSFYLILNKLFGLEYIGYAIVSILMHLFCVYLIYFLAFRVLKNRYLALFSSLFFALNDSGQQATSWIATSINTNGATIFGLLSLIFFQKFLESKKIYRTNNFFISMLFLLISILFKEISVGLFVFYLIVLYFFNKINFDEKKVYLFSLFGLSAIYGVARILMLYASRSNVEQKVVTESQSFFDIFKNLLTFPAKIFSQSLMPTPFLLALSSRVTSFLPSSMTGLQGTTAFDIFTQQYTLQIINWILFLVAVLLIIFLFFSKRKNKFSKILLFSFLFVIMNSFIYVLSPGRNGNIPTVDSRNIYFPSIGTSIFLVALVTIFNGKYKKFAYFLIALIFVLNIFWLNKDLNTLANVGEQRSRILSEIRSDYPKLPDKVVFYTESDSSFYGLPENEKILPFQVNFGYTLLVYYFPYQHYSWNFIELGGYLYDIKAEGYKEVNGKSFGYFRKIDDLKSAYKKYGFSKNDIVAYRYNSVTGSLTNITDEVRSSL